MFNSDIYIYIWAGLYRDDMLGVTELEGKEAERLKQKISDIFKVYGLKVKVEVNKKVVDYLNVTLNLLDGSHRDFTKPGQVINYVHVESNHPPAVTKSIGKGVNYRLNANSSSEAMFDAAKGPYQEALKRSGHTHTLSYDPEVAKGRTKRRRRRNKNDIIWFNPPWCNSVTTDVGRKFLNLLDACFPPSNPRWLGGPSGALGGPSGALGGPSGALGGPSGPLGGPSGLLGGPSGP